MLKGGCFCGFVRYEVEATARHQTNCHCSICRRVSAAPFVAWFSVPAARLTFVSGAPARFASSEHGTRTFCPRCGTPLTFHSSQMPDEIDVTTCSLCDPEQEPSKDHTHVSSKLGWVELKDELPAFPSSRPPDA